MPTAGSTALPDFARRTEEGAVRPGMRQAEEGQVSAGLRPAGKRTPRKRPALDRGTEQPRAVSPLQTEPNIQTGAEGRRNAWKQNEIRNGLERDQDQPQDRNGEKDKIITGKKSMLQSARGRTDFEESSAGATQAGKTQKVNRASAGRQGGAPAPRGAALPGERARQGTRGPGKPPKAGGAELTLRGI